MYVPSQSAFMIYLRVRWHISHNFAVARSRFLAGVAITNISMQLALLYNEPDYLTCNPTSRHGTGYTFTWPRPTVEPVWLQATHLYKDNFCACKIFQSSNNLQWLDKNDSGLNWIFHCNILISHGNTLEYFRVPVLVLTHWGRVTHICVSKLTIIGSDNGLSPDRRQAIIWTIAGILLIGPLGTNFNEILIAILTFSFKKMHLKMSSVKRRPFCLGLNVLNWVLGPCYLRVTRSIPGCWWLSSLNHECSINCKYNKLNPRVKNLEKYLQVPYTSYFLALW